MNGANRPLKSQRRIVIKRNLKKEVNFYSFFNYVESQQRELELA